MAHGGWPVSSASLNGRRRNRDPRSLCEHFAPRGMRNSRTCERPLYTFAFAVAFLLSSVAGFRPQDGLIVVEHDFDNVNAALNASDPAGGGSVIGNVAAAKDITVHHRPGLVDWRSVQGSPQDSGGGDIPNKNSIDEVSVDSSIRLPAAVAAVELRSSPEELLPNKEIDDAEASSSSTSGSFWHHMSRKSRHSWRGRKDRPPRITPRAESTFFVDNLQGRLLDWSIFSAAIGMFVVVHMVSGGTTNSLFLMCLWLVFAVAAIGIIFATRGEVSANDWIAGYFIELIFTMENMFIFAVVFNLWHVPRSQTRTTMIIVAMYQVKFEFALFMGLGAVFRKISWLSYALGIWLCLCAYEFLRVEFCDHKAVDTASDFEDSMLVAKLKWLVGSRFMSSYDHAGAMIIKRDGKYTFTLLLVVTVLIVALDLWESLDSVFTKIEVIDDPVGNLVSSTLVTVAIPDLYINSMALFRSFYCLKYGISVVLLFFAFDLFISNFYPIPAFVSCSVAVVVVLLSILVSVCFYPQSPPPTLNLSGHKGRVESDDIADLTPPGDSCGANGADERGLPTPNKA